MSDTGTIESKDEIKDKAAFCRMWMDAIQISSKDEENWRKQAEDTVKIYRAGSKARNDNPDGGDKAFNILFANIDTIVPSIYNSSPIPDVRRRYDDDDKVGKQVSDLIERAISYSIDSYDFDDLMKAIAHDMELPGRAVARVRYTPYFAQDGQSVVHEEANCELVQWKDFRRGPGKTWVDVPWVAFRLQLTRGELKKLNEKLAPAVQLDASIDGYKDDGEKPSDIFKRAIVWEIWDKDSGEVIFIAESHKAEPLVRDKDPLGLTGFFPTPRPIYSIRTTDSLIPVVPYSTYRDQAEELEKVSKRIMALVEALKAKAIYDGRMVEVDRLSSADDNEMIAVESAANYLDGAGLDKAIAWWPIEAIANVLKELYVQRDQIKQTIYEITGLSDILRGQTDPNETLGAQELKAQTGSMRVQAKQAEIQRFARDLFRLKAEIIATKFSWETITTMTGINFPSAEDQAKAKQLIQRVQQAQQAGQQVPPEAQQTAQQASKVLEQPSREDVEKVLRNDTMRGYRIDVESDSTIRADMTRNQNNMNQFLQGTAEYAKAMGPIVQMDPSMMPTVIEVYSAFARTYKLGKQAEDALDKLSDKGKQMADNPAPKPEDPKLALEKVKMQAAQEKAQQDMEMKKADFQAEMAQRQQEMEVKREELALKKQEMEMKREEAAMKLQQDKEIAAFKLQLDQQKHEQATQFEAEKHQAKMEEQRVSAETTMALGEAKKKEAADNLMFSQTKNRIEVDGAKQRNLFDRESHQNKEKRASEQAEREKKPKVTKFNRGKDGRVESATTEH